MKEVTTKITCDSCSKDISPEISSYPAVYILKVQAINVAEHTVNQMIYSIMCYPPIENDIYFCGLECMKKYGELCSEN